MRHRYCLGCQAARSELVEMARNLVVAWRVGPWLNIDSFRPDSAGIDNLQLPAFPD